MCVIPVYYINAPGQNENEYSHMRALAHTHTAPFKVNKHRYSGGISISAHILYAADDATSEHSRDDPGLTFVMWMLAADRKVLNMNLNVFYTHRHKGLLLYRAIKTTEPFQLMIMHG